MKREKSPTARQNHRNAAARIERVLLDRIRSDPATQIRAAIYPPAVAQYARAMNDPATRFPPVVVFHNGENYILADGFHRVAAAKQNGFTDIEAEVRTGSNVDALRYALSANRNNCLPRSNKDKRRSVALALAQWPELSTREIGRICAVSDPFVAKWQRQGRAGMELEEAGQSGRRPRFAGPTLEGLDLGDEEAEAKRLRYLADTWPATCAHCNQEFRHDKREPEPEACPACAAEVRECKLCGRPFEPRAGREYCSTRCAEWAAEHAPEHSRAHPESSHLN